MQVACIILEFGEIFRVSLDSEPADVSPMVIEVDVDKWEQPKNRQPYRMHTTSKELEIKKAD
jgi:hypothetical protein